MEFCQSEKVGTLITQTPLLKSKAQVTWQSYVIPICHVH